MPAVTLLDVKANLNMTSSVNDFELADMLTDATTAIENLVGPLTAVSVSEEFDEHGRNIVLSRTPVLSLTSVFIEPWLGSAPVDDTSAWRLNRTTGVLRRLVTGGGFPYIGRGSIFTVTYMAGRSPVPGPIRRAVLMQTARMWLSQRAATQPNRGPGPGPGPVSYIGGQGLLDSDVTALLVPYLVPPGVG